MQVVVALAGTARANAERAATLKSMRMDGIWAADGQTPCMAGLFLPANPSGIVDRRKQRFNDAYEQHQVAAGHLGRACPRV